MFQNPEVVVIDSSGKKCPQPIIDLQTVARQSASGTRLCLISTDEGALYDIPTWVKVNRHQLLEMCEDKGSYHFYVKVK